MMTAASSHDALIVYRYLKYMQRYSGEIFHGVSVIAYLDLPTMLFQAVALAIARDTDLWATLTLEQFLLFCSLTTTLRDEILFAQHLRHGLGTTPLVLAPSVAEFLSRAILVREQAASNLWCIVGDFVWAGGAEKLDNRSRALLRQHGDPGQLGEI
jgi:hypothetical protein